MLIGISGTLSSGKTEVARYLTFQGFKLISFKQSGGDDVVSDDSIIELSTPDNSPKDSVDDLVDGKVIKRLETLHPYDEADISGKFDYFSTIEVFQHFEDLNRLLDYVTLNWRENFVISHIDNMDMLMALKKRPFFLHISIDAPILLRYKRYMLRNSLQNGNGLSLEQFIRRNDELLFKTGNPLIEINNQAQVKIINTSTSIKNLYIKLSELNLVDFSRLRPTWDSYFMRLADLAALRSNCMKRRVGCVIVRQNTVIATGYNGTPRHLTNCNEGGCERCNQGQGSGSSLSTCLCLHAEENALLEAGRDRIRDNSVLYCNTCPCLTCSIKIVQSGIREVVYAQSYSMDSASHKVMSEANIILRQFQPPTDGIFI